MKSTLNNKFKWKYLKKKFEYLDDRVGLSLMKCKFSPQY